MGAAFHYQDYVAYMGFNCLVCGTWEYLENYDSPEYYGVCNRCITQSSRIMAERIRDGSCENFDQDVTWDG